MAKPKLLVTRKLPEAVEARIARDYDATFNPADTVRDGAALAAAAAGHDAILLAAGDPFGQATIGALPASVRALATFSVGFDHIDIAAAKARGLIVANTPDVLTDATAEIAMLLILASMRRAGEAERMVRARQWSGWAPTQLMGLSVSGKRLGIFGFGRIGRRLAEMARGFRMEIHYHDIQRAPAELEQGATFHGDEGKFLAICQVLSLNAPGGEATRKWLNEGRIRQLPKRAVVVNSGRGSLVDDAALVAALNSGHVAYAGLDVYDGEPRIFEGYYSAPNVVLLPHLGSAT
ncbi:MAG: D-glycerate dehydrogenase, partial [Acetobacteraceae bacterium]|nr:D-glycerate dehydrogenase [Acetobacteraceae bacterium]